METENAERELDLIDLIKICWGWFVSYICKPLLFLIRFAIKKWWVILLSAIVGFAISYCISTFFPKYTGYVIYENNVGNSSDFINAIRPLAHTSPKYMASALDISENEAVNILAIAPHSLYYKDTLRTSFYVDINDDAPKESIALSNRFAIEVMTDDTMAFSHLQEGFVKYYSRNSFFSKKAESKAKTLDSNSKLARGEAEKLDELRVKGGSSGGVVLSGRDVYSMVDPAAISREVVRLNELSVNQANALEYDSSVITVVSPLMINRIPINHFLFTYKKWVILSVIVGFALALCITYRKKIGEMIKD